MSVRALQRHRTGMAGWRWVVAFACLWLVMLAPPVHAQGAGRILDDADVAETPSRYDLTIRFACSVRYISHAPAAQGVELRVRLTLGQDCGMSGFAAETLVTPAPAVVRSIELSPLIASDVELLIRWRLSQQFMVVPTNDQRGLRIRILRKDESGETRGKILVAEMTSTDVTTAYAINLESSQQPFSAAAIQQAQSALSGRIYTSEVDVEGVHWYRLRLGPIALRADAERMLLTAQEKYPRAWLAIADEDIDESTVSLETEPVTSPVVEAGGDDNVKILKRIRCGIPAMICFDARTIRWRLSI